MNLRVVFSLVLVLVWLAAGLYFLFYAEEQQFAFGNQQLLGWLCLLLMLWNLLRMGMVWSRPKRSHERPF